MDKKFQSIERYAVVFSGGGALGAWEVGAYECLVDTLGKPPATIIGTSAGSLNCAAILAGHEIEGMRKLWDVKWWEVFYIRFRTVLLAILPTAISVGILQVVFKNRYNSLLDSTPLRRKLKEVLKNWDFDRPKTVDFAITLTDIENAQKEVHCIMDKTRFPGQGKTLSIYKEIPNKEALLESLMGSSAIPLLFPPNDKYFFDGGVLNNNPLSVAAQLKEPVIFVLIPAPEILVKEGSTNPVKYGFLDIISHLMTTWIGLGFKEITHTLKVTNKDGKRIFKVCVIRPTPDFGNLQVGLLSFGKNVSKVISNGYMSAKMRLCEFDPADPTSWF